MTTTSAVNNASSVTSALNSADNVSSAQNIENQFLTLLTTQLQNQDPTNPMDNMQLTSQLAQISTVEGISNLNTTLQSISSQMGLSQSIDATSFIGKSVLVQGNSILLGTDSTTSSAVTTPFGINLTGAASDVKVNIINSSGAVVNTVDLGSMSAGVYSYDWNGQTSGGTAATNGSYSFSVTATDSSGNAVTADPLTYGQVGSVAYTSSGPVLNLGTAGTTSLSGVYKVFSTTDDSTSI
ncbi:MAG: flagellar hook capping FlgD N-terminal domain-containing protein [Bordetella sp.]|uniref:flagellar hook capping FlgD N-terminal domain-containing protein n=1 Tax=Bordetella sp. TaxID=28081 RepID=UPI003F7CC3FA